MTIHLKNKPHCPVCDAPLDSVAALHDLDAPIMPRPGDFNVCAYCRSFLRFDENLWIVELTPAEIGALEDEARNALLMIRRLLTKFKAER